MTWSPYPHYKDAGAAWLGEIPAHWTVGSFSKFGRFEGGSGFPHEFQGETAEEVAFHKVNALARATQAGRLKSRDDTVSRATARRLGAKVLPAYSVVFAKVGAALLLGRIASLSEESCIDNNMMAFLPGDKVTPEFARHLLAQVRFDLLVNPGAVPSVSEGQMKRLLTAVPPIKEQRGIAAFLDRETAKIDALIAKQEQLIATLREDRTATITHAVTKGLDCDVELKDSGVEWLGEVARHWIVSRFSRHVAINGGQVDPRLPQYAEMPLIAPNHIESGTGRLLLLETAAEQGADSGKYLVAEGQVIYSKIRPNLVKVVIAPCDTLCSADMYGLLPDSRITTHFLFYLLLSKPFTDYVVESSMRVAMPKVNHESLGGAPLWMPPIHEQREICAYLDDRLRSIDRLTAKAGEVIDALREYRAALITEAVTGKIDVRGVA